MLNSSASPGRDRPSATLWLAASGACVTLAIVLRAFFLTNWDVSWLLHAAERTLDGEIPYRDFLEPNPPAAILIYLPGVLLGRLLALRPEVATDILVFIGTGLSLWLSGAILLRAELADRARARVLLCAALVVLLVLPLHSFAQREQIAVLAVLPGLACLAVRIAGRRPRVPALVLGGVGVGIAIALKPIFALALLGPGLVLVRSRSWRDLPGLLEAWVACGVSAGSALATIVLFPDYARRVLPLVVGIYVPARLPLSDLLSSQPVVIWAVLACTAWWARTSADVVAAVLVLASAGFEAAFFIQGKAFAYHGYPAVALAALGCAHALSGRGDQARTAAGPFAMLCAPAAAVLISGLCLFAESYDNGVKAPGLRQAIAAVSPRPRFLSIGGDMTLGPVFAQEIGGRWVGSAPIAWITFYAGAIAPKPESDPRFVEAIRMERDLYGADIDRQKPDVVLVETDGWLRWTARSPALVEALSNYRRVGRYGGVTLMARALPPSSAQASAVPMGATDAPSAEPAGRPPVP